jgi:hypothetical protein
MVTALVLMGMQMHSAYLLPTAYIGSSGSRCVLLRNSSEANRERKKDKKEGLCGFLQKKYNFAQHF